MMRAKGRLVAKMNVRSMTPEETAKRAKGRVIEKLGKSEYDRMLKQYLTPSELNTTESQSLIDGMIMSLIQQNLTDRMIRQVFAVGNNRIKRIRKIIKNPELLVKKPFVPKHAASSADIGRIKAHLATYDRRMSTLVPTGGYVSFL